MTVPQSKETVPARQRELLEAALPYARRGWRVIPLHNPSDDGACSCGRTDCGSPGKHPRTKNGLKNASIDEETIRQWWTTFPLANIGILTGAVSNLFVLDVDRGHGGDDSLAGLREEFGGIPATVGALTGSGEHIYFAHPGGIVQNSAGKLGEGLDIRGDGGYVVAPPSLHPSGRLYVWEGSSEPDSVPLAQAPGWLLNLIRRHSLRKVDDSQTEDPDFKIPEGGRNNVLTSMAGSMRRRGFSQAAIRAALNVENEQRCDPPLDPMEVRTIAWSVGRYKPADPIAEKSADALKERDAGGPEPEPEHSEDPTSRFRSPAEALREMPDSGGRRSTGLSALDRVTRGGARAGEIWTFVGGPGAAKSTLMEQIARTFADMHKSPIVALHADEGDGPASVRLGQMFGLDREKLEAKDEAEIAALKAEMSECAYVMANPDEVTLEVAIEKLRALKAAFEGPPVLLVDTLHTVRCSAGDDAKSAKERAEKIVEAYKQAARQIPAIVLVASEAVKAAYASPDPDKRINALAAAAETRQIAHAASIQIDMRPTDDENLFEAFVPKNRIGGTKPHFALRLDKASATLTEVDEHVVADQKADKKARAATAESVALQGKIEKAIDNPKNYSEGLPGLSENLLAKLCHVDKRKQAFLDALYGLTEAQKALEAVPGPHDGLYYRRASRPVANHPVADA